MVKAHVFISGRVQGVFFRMYTQREAQALGISGWVRNIYNEKLPVRHAPRQTAGRQGKKVQRLDSVGFTGVEAVFEGEKEAVNEMIAWCWSGSPSAKVTDVKVGWEPFDEAQGKGFEIRR